MNEQEFYETVLDIIKPVPAKALQKIKWIKEVSVMPRIEYISERFADTAAVFRGGGHENAAGFIAKGSIDEIKNPRRKAAGIFFCRGNFLYVWGLLP
jgi:hypothetical protein